MSSTVFFISDHHFGHNNILKFIPNRLGAGSIEEHDEILIKRHNDIVHKYDTVYFLGDVAFTRAGMDKLRRLSGKKILVLGNHDKSGRDLLPKIFCKIHGAIRLERRFWLTHIPIHMGELNKDFNLHGHIHTHAIEDHRYLNLCVDRTQGYPISFEVVKNILCKEK